MYIYIYIYIYTYTCNIYIYVDIHAARRGRGGEFPRRSAQHDKRDKRVPTGVHLLLSPAVVLPACCQ